MGVDFAAISSDWTRLTYKDCPILVPDRRPMVRLPSVPDPNLHMISSDPCADSGFSISTRATPWSRTETALRRDSTGAVRSRSRAARALDPRPATTHRRGPSCVAVAVAVLSPVPSLSAVPVPVAVGADRPRIQVGSRPIPACSQMHPRRSRNMVSPPRPQRPHSVPDAPIQVSISRRPPA